MEYNFETLFKKGIPQELDQLLDLIDLLYEAIKEKDIKLRWSSPKFVEYGFYIESADKTYDLFCGMWFSLWKSKSYPFCLALNWKPNTHYTAANDLKKILDDNRFKDLKYLHYDDYPLVGFELEYFKTLSDHHQIIEIIQEITILLKFNIYFNR